MTFIWIGIGWNTISLYADPVISDWGIGRTQFMLCITLVSGGNTIVSLLAYGQIEARLGIRKVMVLGGCASTVAFAIMALSQNLPMLYVGAALFGFGVAFLSNNTFMTAVNHWFAKRQGTMTGIVTTVGSASGILFATVMAIVIGAVGWRLGFGITAIASALATIVVFVLYKGDPEQLGELPLYAESKPESSNKADGTMEEAEGIGYADMFKTPQFYLIVLAFTCGGIACYAAFSNLAIFAVDLGYEAFSGAALSIALAASAVGMTPGGIIVDKLGAKWMIALCCILLIAGMAILMMTEIPLPLLFASCVLLGLGYCLCQVPAGAAVMDAFGPKEYSKKLGTCAGFVYLGVALAPVVMSAFYDLTGTYQLSLIILVAMSIATAVLIFPATKSVQGQQRLQNKDASEANQ